MMPITLIIVASLIGVGLACYEHIRIMRSYEKSEEITTRILNRIKQKEQIEQIERDTERDVIISRILSKIRKKSH